MIARLLCLLALLGSATSIRTSAAAGEQHLLYVAEPGIRDYVEWGGVGILVYDIDHGHRLVKRIKTFDVPPGKAPDAVKGICASARTGRVYVSTTTRVLCLDLVTEKPVWEKAYEGGCDRLAMSPDGKTLYLPSLEGPFWNVVDADTGALVTRIETDSGAHNTIFGPDGTRVYMAGLKSPVLNVADAQTHRVVQTVGPFANVIRPFTINHRQTLCYVNVNDLLGFEIGDLKTGKMLCRVEVTGYAKGPTKRHGCPSHGIGLTPDECEIWVDDSFNSRIHVYDAATMPPAWKIDVPVRDQPGWITFSIDGRFAYPSTGDVIDTRAKRIVATLADEGGRPVQSEKLLEIDFRKGRPIRAGDQFGIGRRR